MTVYVTRRYLLPSCCNWRQPIVVLGFVVTMASLLRAGSVGCQVTTKPDGAHTGEFLVVSEKEAYHRSFGMAMVCPAHAHGTPQDAKEKLKGILLDWPEGKKSSIYVCRSNQIGTLKMFAPLVDRAFVNPFCIEDDSKPPTGTNIWPGLDHPCVNHMRRIYDCGKSATLVGSINLEGESSLYTKRQPTFEEIKWMVLTVVGSGFRGIMWRGHRSEPPIANGLNQVQRVLEAYSTSLGSAVLRPDIADSTERSCTALLGQDTLYVVTIDSRYLRRLDGGKEVGLPLGQERKSGSIELSLPSGTSIGPGKAVFGSPVSILRKGGSYLAEYAFEGSGDLVCFPLRKADVSAKDAGGRGSPAMKPGQAQNAAPRATPTRPSEKTRRSFLGSDAAKK